MTGILAGKVALITGSGRGMGQAHAVLLAENGADVIVHDIVAERVAETAALVRSKGRQALEAVVDVADAQAMAHLVERAEKTLGRIDILVNNAGIGADRAVVEDIDEAMYDRMFGIHVRGSFFTTRAVVPGMRRRKSGVRRCFRC